MLSPYFKRDVLSCEPITRYIDEHFVLWVGNIRDKEGYILTNELRATTYPFLAIVSANTGGSRGELLQRLEGLGDF